MIRKLTYYGFSWAIGRVLGVAFADLSCFSCQRSYVYDSMDPLDFRMARSSRKHKIGRWRVEQAVDNASFRRNQGDALIYVGLDDTGLLLEIVFIPDDRDPTRYTCIHAMPAKWRDR